MTRKDSQIMRDYHRELPALTPYPAWMRWAIGLATVLLFAALVLLSFDVLQTNDYPRPTDWCGDLPPVYGSDC